MGTLSATPLSIPKSVPDSATRLLVVRHGESDWNASGRWQGRADVPLNRAGMLQAAGAAEVLGMFDAIWSSHLQRAVLTAQIIAELLGVGPVEIDHRLCENDVGPWEGLDRDAVESGWPGFLADRRRPDGFESYEDASDRMSDALLDIAAQHPGGEVLVVSHGGVMGALRRRLGGPDERFPNLGGGWIIAQMGAAPERHRLVLGDRVSLSAPEQKPAPTPVSEIL